MARAPRYCLSFSWYCSFLLTFDEKAQWPPRVRDCCLCVPPPRIDDSFLSSLAVCLKSGTPVMAVYSPSQRLPRFNSVAAFSSCFSSICALTISRVPRETSVPTFCSDHFYLLHLSVHICATFLLVVTKYTVAQNSSWPSDLFMPFFAFQLPAPTRIFSEARLAKRVRKLRFCPSAPPLILAFPAC